MKHEKENLELPSFAARAKSLGLQFYYTGSPCLRGHLSRRYVSSGNCVKCIAERRGRIDFNRRSDKVMRNKKDHALAMEAHDKGETTYVPHEPCKRGHLLRYVTTNNCVQCGKETFAKHKHKRRWQRIFREYGMTELEFDNMLTYQAYKCPVCTKAIAKEKTTHIDHNHKTGRVRGILCSRCNQGMGLMLEDVGIMRRAVKYIEENDV